MLRSVPNRRGDDDRPLGDILCQLGLDSRLQVAARAAELGLLNAVVASAEELRKDVDDRVAMLLARSPRVHADIRDMLRAFGAVGDDQALDMSIDRLVVGSLRRGEG